MGSKAPPSRLSEVATAFRTQVPQGTHSKDEVEYRSCFTGEEAVVSRASPEKSDKDQNTIVAILHTQDRNIALLVGRALDAQNFISDVNYEHRLRDTDDLYQLAAVLDEPSKDANSVELDLPNGVFTLLTPCYSPTCSNEHECYSPSCPRRTEQRDRTKVIAQSEESLIELEMLAEAEKPQDDWWSNTVPREIVDSVSKNEEKRQNAIYDIIKTERNYVEELKTIQTSYFLPLQSGEYFEEARKDSLTRRIFSNCADILRVNSKLLQKLYQRQKENYIVETIGDIFANIASEFFIYVEYCGNREYSRNEIAHERATNPAFRDFLIRSIAKSDSRLDNKQELDGYLHKPVARMGSYILLLKAILEKTPDGHPDKVLIPQAVKAFSEVLSKMNEASGQSINSIKLVQLQQLINHDTHELKLDDPNRQYIYEGEVILKRGTGDIPLKLFLFDHILLMTRERADRKAADGDNNGVRPKGWRYSVYKKPLPLELVLLMTDSNKDRRISTYPSNQKTLERTSSLFKPTNKSSTLSSGPAVTVSSMIGPDTKLSFSLTHLGRNGGVFTFATETESARISWRECIEKQRKLRTRIVKFEMLGLAEARLPTACKVNCSASHGTRLILATDNGLYVGPEGSLTSMLEDGWSKYVRVLDLERIIQVDVLKDHDTIILLSDKTILSFPLEILDSPATDSGAGSRKGKKIADSINFFKLGVCADRTVLCAVRSSPLSSIVKVFEPVGLGTTKRRGKLGRLFMGSSESTRLLNEFYIPAEALSIHFLKTKFCVGCTKGFEIVDFESLNTQGLLDPSDSSLIFAMNKETVRPIAIFRVVENNYILCYNEFGFYVDKFGRRARGSFLINWSGTPSAFAFVSPYVVAFEPSFVEVWNVNTGLLQQVVAMNGLRPLNVGSDSIHGVMESAGDTQFVFRLKRPDQQDEN